MSKYNKSASRNRSKGQSLSLEGCSVAVIVSEYNAAITRSMETAAVQTLTLAGLFPEDIAQHTVPGAWELVLATQWMLERTDIDGVVALGCVIRGETTHDQHINRTVSNALMELSIDYGKPVGFGLLTVENLAQAQARAGGEVGNKGDEAAGAVVAMLRLQQSLGGEQYERED